MILVGRESEFGDGNIARPQRACPGMRLILAALLAAAVMMVAPADWCSDGHQGRALDSVCLMA